MPNGHSREQEGALTDYVLAELRDYLLIFQETAEPGLTFELVGEHLVIAFKGATVGTWSHIGDDLIFEGQTTSYFSSLQSAVLHTLGVLADVVSLS
jgi:hypothetical protein